MKAFELSQSLREKWVTADFSAKQQILEILCLNCRLENTTLVCTIRKPFDVLVKSDVLKMVGATGFESVRPPDQTGDNAGHPTDSLRTSPIEQRQIDDTSRQLADTSDTSPCCASVARIDLSLDFLIQHWPTLPAAIRESILTIAQAVVEKKAHAK